MPRCGPRRGRPAVQRDDARATTRSTTARSSRSSGVGRRRRTTQASAASSRSTSGTSEQRPAVDRLLQRRHHRYDGQRAEEPRGVLGRRGLPGTRLPPVVSPPDPDLMVGIIDGNSTGEIVDAIDARYGPGDEILRRCTGTVMNVLDFAYTVPSTVTINTNQDRSGTVSMAVSENAAFTGVVETTAFPDAGDPAHPWGTTLAPITFAPSPMTPNGTVTWATFQTTGAPDGIYTVWIQGHSSTRSSSTTTTPSASRSATSAATSRRRVRRSSPSARREGPHREPGGQHAEPQRHVLRRVRRSEHRGRSRGERRPAHRHRRGECHPVDDHPRQGRVLRRFDVDRQRDVGARRLSAHVARDWTNWPARS